MSETNIIGKPVVPSVRVSTNDPHRLTVPVPRPIRHAGDGTEQNPGLGGGESRPLRGGAEGGRPKRNIAGGQPVKSQTPDVVISAQPQIEHTTSNTSSRNTVIQRPQNPRPGRQPQRPGLVGSNPVVQHGAIPADEAELVDQLLRSYHDGLPTTAANARALAQRAAASVDLLKSK
jgi:hypothetical protein